MNEIIPSFHSMHMKELQKYLLHVQLKTVSVFLSRKFLTTTTFPCAKAQMVNLCTPLFLYIKVGFKWVLFSWTCFPDAVDIRRAFKKFAEKCHHILVL